MLGCLSHVQSNVHAQSRLSSTLQDYGGRILDLISDDFSFNYVHCILQFTYASKFA